MGKDGLVPLDVELPAELRQRTIDDEPKLLEQMNQGNRQKSKTYKHVCEATIVKFDDFKFDSILGKVQINGTIQACCKAFMEYASNIDEHSPEQCQNFQVFQKFFFWNDEDRRKYQAVSAGTAFEDFSFYVHTCTRSPSPAIVKHRDFVVIGRMSFKEDGKKATLTMQGVDYEHEVKGIVRGRLVNNSFVFTQKDSSTAEVEFFAQADPLGAVPPFIYNMALDMRCDIIILLKNFIEGKEKPIYKKH